MNKKAIIPLVLVGGAIAYSFKTAADKEKAIKSLQLRNPRINSFSAQLSQISFNLSFELYNPSSTSLSFDQFAGTVEYGGRALGSFAIPVSNTKTLAPFASTPVTFRVNLSSPLMALSLVNLISSLIKGAAKNVDPFLYVNNIYVITSGVSIRMPNITYDLRTQSIAGIGKRKGGFLKVFKKIITPPHVRIMQAIKKKVKGKIMDKARRQIMAEQGQNNLQPVRRRRGFRRPLTPQEIEQRNQRRLAWINQRRAASGLPALTALPAPGTPLQSLLPALPAPAATVTPSTVTAQNMATVAPAAASATNYMPGVPMNGVFGYC